MIKCQYIQLHAPLFLAGTNYGDKLKAKSGKGTLELLYDEENRRAKITSDKGFCYITESSVFSYEPEQGVIIPVQKHYDHRIAPVNAQIGGPNSVFTAQVSNPITDPPKTIRRRARFQGEEGQQE